MDSMQVSCEVAAWEYGITIVPGCHVLLPPGGNNANSLARGSPQDKGPPEYSHRGGAEVIMESSLIMASSLRAFIL